MQKFPALSNVIKNFKFKNSGGSTAGGIACTDAASQIEMNAAALAGESEDEQAAVIAHEAMHTEEHLPGMIGNIATDP